MIFVKKIGVSAHEGQKYSGKWQGGIEKGLLSNESSTATMLYSVPSSEKTKAVQYLIDHIHDETMRDVKKAMDQNGKDRG